MRPRPPSVVNKQEQRELKQVQKRRFVAIGIPVQEMKKLLRLREASLSIGKVPATMKSILGLETGQVVREGDSCPICLEDMATSSGSKVIRMPCDHRFHSPCLVRWLMANHSCPMCRYEMPASLRSQRSCSVDVRSS